MHSPFCEVTFQRLRVGAYAFSSLRRPSARSSAGVHFYGRRRLGRIQGSGMMVGVAGAAIGPLPLALLEAAFNGFTEGLLALMILPVLAIIVISSARPVSDHGGQ